MGLYSDGKDLMNLKAVQSFFKKVIENAIGVLLCDRKSLGNLMKNLSESPAFFREQLFLMKLEKFISGVFLSDDDRDFLKKKLSENDKSNENARRIIECIDRIDSEDKEQYLINATRNLINDLIDRTTYFRICNVLKETLLEDLEYIKRSIEDSDNSNKIFEGNQNTIALARSGLMIQSGHDIDKSVEKQEYTISSLGYIFYQYACLISDEDNLHINKNENFVELKYNANISPISREDIDKMFDE